MVQVIFVVLFIDIVKFESKTWIFKFNEYCAHEKMDIENDVCTLS